MAAQAPAEAGLAAGGGERRNWQWVVSQASIFCRPMSAWGRGVARRNEREAMAWALRASSGAWAGDSAETMGPDLVSTCGWLEHQGTDLVELSRLSSEAIFWK